jgi:hypothetical protein
MIPVGETEDHEAYMVWKELLEWQLLNQLAIRGLIYIGAFGGAAHIIIDSVSSARFHVSQQATGALHHHLDGLTIFDPASTTLLQLALVEFTVDVLRFTVLAFHSMSQTSGR